MSRDELQNTNRNNGLIPLGPIPSQAPVAAFNKDLHESLLKTKGFVDCLHYRHALHPDKKQLNGPADLSDAETTHRGYRYYRPRRVSIIPQTISVEERLQTQGVFKIGSCLINIGGMYLDVNPGKDGDELDRVVYVRPSDLIVFPTLTEMVTQRFEFNETGPQILKYKIRGVDYLADSNQEYREGSDFYINEKGLLYFTKSGKSSTKTSVFTIVYYITPIYVVQNMLHGLRVIPANETGSGALPREALYAPQQFVVRASHLMEEGDILDFNALPPYPGWRSGNSSGGSW